MRVRRRLLWGLGGARGILGLHHFHLSNYGNCLPRYAIKSHGSLVAPATIQSYSFYPKKLLSIMFRNRKRNWEVEAGSVMGNTEGSGKT